MKSTITVTIAGPKGAGTSQLSRLFQKALTSASGRTLPAGTNAVRFVERQTK